jgi:dipeptidyl aminopeptidase/acylaminoacyl peptidase
MVVVAGGLGLVAAGLTPRPDAAGRPPAVAAAQAPGTRYFSPRWSPDGQRILFEANIENPQRLDLYVIGLDGSAPVKLRENGRGGSWSRDGRRVLYASMPEGNLDVFDMAADGRDVRQLTRDSTMDYMPAWSPDGSRIAFVSIPRGPGMRHDVYVMNADGTGRAAVTQTPAEEMGPSWSPDGRWIAFGSNRDGNWELYATSVDGGEVRRLTNDPAADNGPAFSPDGRFVAFASNRDGTIGIWRIRADGTEPTRLGTHPGATPAWSPDSRRLAYAAQVDGAWGIFVMNADGTDARRLTALPVVPPDRLAQVRWLAGCWERRSNQRVTLEMWMPPDGNLMLGASRTVQGGVAREFEHLRLEAPNDSGIVYTALPSGQAETPFRSTLVSDSGFTVENLAHDFPQRIIYRRHGADSLVARIEGPGPNGPRGIDFPMRRIACATP